LPLLWDQVAGGEGADEFLRAFRAGAGAEPDCTAALSYDAVRLLLAAIRRAGLNRALIRDALRELSPWPRSAGIRPDTTRVRCPSA